MTHKTVRIHNLLTVSMANLSILVAVDLILNEIVEESTATTSIYIMPYLKEPQIGAFQPQ